MTGQNGRTEAPEVKPAASEPNYFDEFVFRVLYIAAGCVCVWAIILHSQEFCTSPKIGMNVGKANKQQFAGPNGLVANWLKVESVLSMGLPTISVIVLVAKQQDRICARCILYIVSALQTAWFIVGCLFSYETGKYVPEECQKGQMGDNTAFLAMWWICTIWLGLVAFSGVLSFFVGCYQLERVHRMWSRYREEAKRRRLKSEVAVQVKQRMEVREKEGFSPEPQDIEAQPLVN
mmetsp:Transcript_49183/g.76748  ORF Transcript_49183/g.76748 Transcript_49183/m.76748 type:complete len:234 (+) Transcript_49183:79-780(+)